MNGRRVVTLERGATFTSDQVADLLREIVPGIELLDAGTLAPYVTDREAGRLEFNRLVEIARSRGVPVPFTR